MITLILTGAAIMAAGVVLGAVTVAAFSEFVWVEEKKHDSETGNNSES